MCKLNPSSLAHAPVMILVDLSALWVGGILIAVGLLMRFAALGIFIYYVLINVMFAVTTFGFPQELVFIALVLVGPGAYSLDDKLFEGS
jgi:uncharacterized membrane protein YphA (DoxX/SURF4 family)